MGGRPSDAKQVLMVDLKVQRTSEVLRLQPDRLAQPKPADTPMSAQRNGLQFVRSQCMSCNCVADLRGEK